MLKFVDKDFLLTMNNDSGIIVIDADLQGAWEINEHAQMRWAFPRAYKIYKQFCLSGYAQLGTSLLVEDSNYKIVILFTKRNRKDSKEIVLKYFSMAIDDMLRKVPSDVYIYSPILGRIDKCFDEMLVKINKITNSINGIAGYNWFVYNKKGMKYD